MSKTTLSLFVTLVLIASTSFGQVSIQCPDDVTITYENYDDTFESFGNPSITTNDNFELNKEVEHFGYICDSLYSVITYEVETINAKASCSQKITLLRPGIEVFKTPQDVLDFQGRLDEATPEITGDIKDLTITQTFNYFVTYSDTIIQGDQANKPKLIRTWYVLDWCSGNVVESDQLIILNGSNAIFNYINLQTCANEVVDSVLMKVETDQVGFQLVNNLCALQNGNIGDYINCIVDNNALLDQSKITLTFSKEDEYIRGVSTLDLVIILRHILGINPFRDTCGEIAADVNNDGVVSSLDLITLRRLILGVQTNLTLEPWRFVSEAYLQDPTQGSLQTDLTFEKSEFPIQSLEVKAIKVGDVSAQNK